MRDDMELTSQGLLERIFFYMEQLVQENDFQKTMELLTNLGKDIVGAERASFWYRDEEKGVYRTLVALGSDPIVVPKGRGVVGEAIEDNKSVICNIPYLNDNFYSEADWKTGFTTHAILCVPVTNENGHVIGAYQVLNKEGEVDEFNEQDASRLALVAGYCGKTLETQLLLEENRIDTLTGLKNRKGFNDSVKELNDFASIILCDIDFFKKVNDTYGHNVGDAVLVHIGDLMKKCAREIIESDIEVFRWGGEEFIILMPDIEVVEAKAFAESLRNLVEKSECYSEGNHVSVTMSFGVATISKDEELTASIKKADDNLYSAKQQGRNRVIA